MVAVEGDAVQIREATAAVEPIENPFGPELSPIRSE
jgi:hypothetical protein